MVGVGLWAGSSRGIGAGLLGPGQAWDVKFNRIVEDTELSFMANVTQKPGHTSIGAVMVASVLHCSLRRYCRLDYKQNAAPITIHL